MRGRALRAFATVAVLVASATGVTAASAAGGTFTKITTPSHTLTYKFNGNPGATNDLTVAGQTSLDVTDVDIDCILLSQENINVQTLATAVPVSSGAFNTTVSFSRVTNNCRLRAIPAGVDAAAGDYIGAYSGPILYTNTFIPIAQGVPDGFAAIAEQGSGVAAVTDASTCGVQLMATVTPPSMTLLGPGLNSCQLFLPPNNLTSSGTATAGALRVDGHNAYLPADVTRFLNGTRGLTVTPTRLATTFTRRSSGDLTVTESAPLVRCSVNDSYPPTNASCPDVVKTGITFTRTTDLFRGAHQVRFRDAFTSTDSKKHAVTAQYQAYSPVPPAGKTGYIYPGHSAGFASAAPSQVVTGLGTKAGTLLVRSDLYAAEGDAQADTVGWSWSRAPSKVQFSHDATTLAMPYSLVVPAAGSTRLGFADSEGNSTSAVRALAAQAVKEMVVAPTITSPTSGSVVHGHLTTVKGTVSRGANGLPTSVTVNGHTAKLTKVSATKDAYAVTFSESFGKHTLKVVARDVAGNTASRSRSISNAA